MNPMKGFVSTIERGLLWLPGGDILDSLILSQKGASNIVSDDGEFKE